MAPASPASGATEASASGATNSTGGGPPPHLPHLERQRHDREFQREILLKTKSEWTFSYQHPSTFTPDRSTTIQSSSATLNEDGIREANNNNDDDALPNSSQLPQYREREFSSPESSPFHSDAENTDDEEVSPKSKKSWMTPEATLRILKHRRRQKQVEREMDWNGGLRHWMAQRDAWSGGRVVYVPLHRRSRPSEASSTEDGHESSHGSESSSLSSSSSSAPSWACSTFPHPKNQDEIVLTAHDFKALSLVSAEDEAIMKMEKRRRSAMKKKKEKRRRSATKGKEKKKKEKTRKEIGGERVAERSDREKKTKRERIENVRVEQAIIPPPLIPKAKRIPVTPKQHSTIYTKFVVQGCRVNGPINLGDLMGVIVKGWKKDGLWAAAIAGGKSGNIDGGGGGGGGAGIGAGIVGGRGGRGRGRGIGGVDRGGGNGRGGGRGGGYGARPTAGANGTDAAPSGEGGGSGTTDTPPSQGMAGGAFNQKGTTAPPNSPRGQFWNGGPLSSSPKQPQDQGRLGSTVAGVGGEIEQEEKGGNKVLFGVQREGPSNTHTHQSQLSDGEEEEGEDNKGGDRKRGKGKRMSMVSKSVGGVMRKVLGFGVASGSTWKKQGDIAAGVAEDKEGEEEGGEEEADG